MSCSILPLGKICLNNPYIIYGFSLIHITDPFCTYRSHIFYIIVVVYTHSLYAVPFLVKPEYKHIRIEP
jgi:hypothetical protein